MTKSDFKEMILGNMIRNLYGISVTEINDTDRLEELFTKHDKDIDKLDKSANDIVSAIERHLSPTFTN